MLLIIGYHPPRKRNLKFQNRLNQNEIMTQNLENHIKRQYYQVEAIVPINLKNKRLMF